MLQLAFIRQNAELVKERLGVRNFKQPELVDEIVTLDGNVRKLKAAMEDANMQLNNLSADIQGLYKKGQKQEADKLKEKATQLKTIITRDKPDLDEAEKILEEKLILLPNLPAVKVPRGKTPADNITIREGGEKPQLPAGAQAHWDLAKKYNLIDFDLGNKITG